MTMTPSEAVIAEHLKTLRLPAIGREYQALSRSARDGGWPYEDFLKELLEAEVRARQEHTAALRLRQAHFPDIKTLEQIDWNAIEGVSRPKILELSSCAFIRRAEDIVLAGPIGTGKRHLAIALGVEAARRRFRVQFRRAANIVRELVEARDERMLGRLQQKVQRVDLLIIDELGFVPLSKSGAELLFEVFRDRHS